ncbi:MAG: bifunctional phosphopantothenoylcysteine decarboxylase/phosphopantothenate--cysteine ligase CoaBC [Gemmatimonadetes bacterium]|nr:bifunctional phosphopantothenoylcysteine decarboxylase/phosphopantothenate--cysteine ligase CoaBC [Gemmatimonadota bacterium]MYG14943.1 bifunctional phosphopantothenoylcysteine decarboxylase/phosphopantothenate--cysteine ligase CoaBC [Gemmatimonadota bacterium]
MSRLKGRRIVLGVTGSISAYKAAEVVRGLVREEADVRVVMTREAGAFVGAVTFSALTGHPVAVEQFPDTGMAGEEHVDLAVWADTVAIAPATANMIGKMANGLGDDLLSTVMLACEAPCCLAPAMNFRMWRNEAVQSNLDRLRSRGVHVIEPEFGLLANGEEGDGRLAAPEQIVEAVAILADPDHDLAGCNVLVSAGPTAEDIDPVRCVTNRSSGKMGYALARAAARRGASVTLVAGPTHLQDPYGVAVEHVRTAGEMREAVLANREGQHAVIMAAAVADYRPGDQSPRKTKKTEERLTLEMTRTTDILAEVAADRPPVLIGFAAETHDGLDYARRKRSDKDLDLVVYNDLTTEGAGFETDTNIVTLIHRDGREESLPLQSKSDVADRVMDEVAALLRNREVVPA